MTNTNSTIKLLIKHLDTEELRLLCIRLASGLDSHKYVITSESEINDVYQEAYSRKLFNKAVIFNLHTWALCNYGFCDKWPNWFLDIENHWYNTLRGVKNDSVASN